MWSWARFRVELNCSYLETLVLEACECLIVEVDVRGLTTGSLDPIHIDTESVVLAGDLNTASLQVTYWVVRTPMAKAKLECVCTESPTKELMPKADTHDGLDAYHFLDLSDHVIERRRITGPIAEEYKVVSVHP